MKIVDERKLEQFINFPKNIAKKKKKDKILCAQNIFPEVLKYILRYEYSKSCYLWFSYVRSSIKHNFS